MLRYALPPARRSLLLAIVGSWLALLAVSGQTKRSSAIDVAIQQLNDAAPIPVDGGQITRAHAQDSTIVVTIILDSLATYDYIRRHPALARQSVLTTLKTQQGLTKIVSLKTNLTYQYLSPDEENPPLPINLSRATLDSLLTVRDNAPTPTAQLRAHLLQANQNNNKTANGMTQTSVADEGTYIVYNILVDEAQLSVDQLMANKENITASMRSALLNDATHSTFVSLCRALHKNLAYRYRGSVSNKTCLIVIDL